MPHRVSQWAAIPVATVTMVSAIADKIFSARWWIFAATLLVSLGSFAVGGGKIEELTARVASLESPPPAEPREQSFDTRQDIWFPEDHPGLTGYENLKRDFVSQDTILLGLESHDPDGVFSPGAIKEIARLTAELEKIPYVRNVRSLTKVPWLRRDPSSLEDSLVVSDLFEKAPETYSDQEKVERIVAVLGKKRAEAVLGPQRVAQLAPERIDVLGEPRMINTLISEDATRAVIFVDVWRPQPKYKSDADRDALTQVQRDVDAALLIATVQSRVAEQVEALVAKAKAYPIYLTGLPVTDNHFNRVSEADMAYVLLMFVLIFAVLVVVFRGLGGPSLALGIVALSLVGMVGFVFASGDLLNNMTAIAPILIVVVGVADSIHLISTWSALRPVYDDRKELVREALRRTLTALFLTTATTAIGFFSLCTSEIFPIVSFGYTVGYGCVVAWLFTVSLVPAILSLIPPMKTEKRKQFSGGEQKALWAVRVVEWAVRYRKPVVGTTLVLTIFAIVVSSRIRLASDFRDFFEADDPVIADLRWFEKNLGGYGDLEIVFQQAGGSESGHALAEDIRFLSRVDELEQRLEVERKKPGSGLDLIADISSPLDILRKMHQVQHHGDPAYYRLPLESDIESSARQSRVDVDPITGEKTIIPGQSASTMVAQYYLQYENGAKPSENLSTAITPDRRQFRLSLRVSPRASDEEIAAYSEIERILRTDFPDLSGARSNGSRPALAKATVTGQQYLFAHLAPLFNETLLYSLGLSLVTITLIMMLVFRSIWVGLVTLIPNVLPLIFPIAAVVLLGIPIDGPAVIVMAIALGVCVDDTIHLISHVFQRVRQGDTIIQALLHAAGAIGNAMLWTSLSLAMGFLVLTLAGFRPNVMTGWLGSSMVMLAWVMDMIVTPAVFAMLTERFGGRKEAEPGSAGEDPPAPALPLSA